jgi:large subunit ribosomal protein L5
MYRLLSWYQQIISKDLIYKLNPTNVFKIDQLKKLALTCNTNIAVDDPKNVVFTLVLLELLCNQKSKIIRAKKSIAAFRLRQFVPLGSKITLRNKKIYYWLDLLFSVIQPKLPEVIFLNANLKEKMAFLGVGLPSVFVFPQLSQENNCFLKDLGLTLLLVGSIDKKKENMVLLTSGFQAPSTISNEKKFARQKN